ncbi:proline racemase family [Pseudohyphozyma bogoriensis]|nr:proline racemase family [Pseudohyphozyma bogoriensis]
MHFKRSINVVGAHCGGEKCDVIVGGVPHIPGATMFDKVRHLIENEDDIRQLLIQEPRGACNRNVNLLTSPCDPSADIGLIIMEADEYPAMSGGNIISSVTVAVETGMVRRRNDGRVVVDTPAGLVETHVDVDEVTGKVTRVTFDNVPAFVWGLDLPVEVPGLGSIKVDIAWGGMFYVLVDVASVGLQPAAKQGAELVRIGELIKKAVREQHHPVHPEHPEFKEVTIIEFMGPLEVVDGIKKSTNAVVVSPGRLDRCACGTGTSARLAVLHARGLLDVEEEFRHRSPIGCEFVARIKGTTKVGEVEAVLPSVGGQAWIMGFHQYVLDPTDPFPTGFRVSDLWPDNQLQGTL